MKGLPYTISEDGKSITCHRCGRTSLNQKDVANCYCSHCKCYFEVGLDPNREAIDLLANLIDPVLAGKKYVLLVLTPGKQEGTSGNHAHIVSNLATEEVRYTLKSFLEHLDA
jgi:transcription elongation factor Elf1